MTVRVRGTVTIEVLIIVVSTDDISYVVVDALLDEVTSPPAVEEVEIALVVLLDDVYG